jgi:hypothetical protein
MSSKRLATGCASELSASYVMIHPAINLINQEDVRKTAVTTQIPGIKLLNS